MGRVRVGSGGTELSGTGLSDAELSGQRAAGWVAVALVVLVPLVLLPAAFGPFHAPKFLAVAVLVPVGLAVCAAGGRLRWPRRNWFLVWIGVSAVATVLGVAPWVSLLGSPNRNAGFLAVLLGAGAFVLGASTGDDATVQRRVLRASFVAGGVVGVLGVAERLGVGLAGLGDAGEITRARSTWGSATFAGAHLALVLPIAVAHLRSRDPRWRAGAVAATVAMVAGLLATGTRGAWLATAVAAAIVVPAWRAGAPRSSRATRPRWVVPLAVGAAAVVVGLFVVPQLDRTSGVGRLDQWRTTVDVIAERPLLGSGPDTQRVVLPSGIDEQFEREHGSEELHDRAHNLVLDTLVTTGVLGLVALVALVGVLCRDVAVRLGRRLVPTSVAAGLVAYLVTLGFAFGDAVIDPVAWLLAGLLVVAVRGDDEQPAPSADQPGPRDRIVAGGLAVLALVGALWASGEVLAEVRLQQAVDEQAAGEIDAALDTLDAAAAVAPARYDLDQIAARIVTQTLSADPTAAGVGRVDAAFARLDRAERIAGDDPDLLMDRAELLTAAGDPDAALELYDVVLERYPRSFRAQLGIGLAASMAGDDEFAEAAWRRAVRLAPGDPRAQQNLDLLLESQQDAAVAGG